MSISYPINIPTHVDANAITLRTVNSVAASMSPFSNKQQVVAHSGQRWEAEVTLPPMNRADAEQWVAFLVSLRGMLGTFLMGDPSGVTPRGSAGGTPIIQGSSQTGDVLIIDGATANQTGWLKSGDYLQVGAGATASLHKVLADVNSDSGGNVTIDIWPSIKTAPTDNSTVVLSSAKGLFRLISNETSWNITAASIYGITFGARQAL